MRLDTEADLHLIRLVKQRNCTLPDWNHRIPHGQSSACFTPRSDGGRGLFLNQQRGWVANQPWPKGESPLEGDSVTRQRACETRSTRGRRSGSGAAGPSAPASFSHSCAGWIRPLVIHARQALSRWGICAGQSFPYGESDRVTAVAMALAEPAARGATDRKSGKLVRCKTPARTARHTATFQVGYLCRQTLARRWRIAGEGWKPSAHKARNLHKSGVFLVGKRIPSSGNSSHTRVNECEPRIGHSAVCDNLCGAERLKRAIMPHKLSRQLPSVGYTGISWVPSTG